MASGVYEIRNLSNGHSYVGSAVNFKQRRYVHLSALRRGKHHSPYLQRAFNLYGEAMFGFRPLIFCEPFELRRYEQALIDGCRPAYNVSRDAEAPMAGRQQSTEARRKISESLKGNTHTRGKKWTEEQRRNSEGRKNALGTPCSEETRRKISEARMGQRPSEETRRKLSEVHKGRRPWNVGLPAWNRGRHHPEETLRRISQALKGKSWTEAQRLAQSTPECRAKKSAANSESHKGQVPWNTGKKWSDEARRKMSESHKRYWARKRSEVS